MPSQPESQDLVVLRAFLRRAIARTRWTSVAAGAAAALTLLALVAAFGVLSLSVLPTIAITAGTVMLGAAGGLLIRRLFPSSVEQTLEVRTPASRNLLLTAFEIADGRTRVAPYVAERVLKDATALANKVDLRRAFPARRSALALLTATVVFAVALGTRPLQSLGRTTAARAGEPVVRSVSILVTPPPYTNAPTRTVRDVERIEVLAGSRLDITVAANAGTVALTTVAGTEAFTARSSSEFTATAVADADGFISIEPRSVSGAPGERTLIGLSVIPDRAPGVRVTSPGKDLLLPSGRRSLSVAIEADDDQALESLKLAYTRISGSGENFTFTGGEVPVELRRANTRAWSATATWQLDSLKLEPGDMVVYRGVASDRRPGAKPSESDSFFVEIAAPGALPSEGFAIDDRQDKYAISQQMVIVKTERLLAARRALPPSDFQEQVLDLAAEQRQVRAEFVFMMGGELADAGLDLSSLNEETEAAGEADLAAGRSANQGRLDLLRAIRSMSRAAARLGDADATSALPLEKEALGFLQRAFSRSRYILRTLGVRERLDASRRLTGLLSALAADRRPPDIAEPNPRTMALRGVLADLAALASESGRQSRVDTARARTLAQRVLLVDPGAQALKNAAAALIGADFDRAATLLAAYIRTDLPAHPATHNSSELDALAGALADALRERSRR